ncbi:MAG: penicillin acylase family protein, partial [Ignavibacteria bacterium]|nr:penicillin acylase family protein [Ignavibacteria bacterium]
TLWEPTSRVQRIRQLLHSSEKFTADDFKQFQQDIMSLYARDILGHLMNAFEGYENNDREISDALNYLHNWDFRFTQNDIAATIFNSFFVHLLHNIYADEMGEDIFRDFVFFGAIPYRVTGQLLAADSSAWFDDVKTARVETKDEILRKSLSDGVRELQGALGTEMKTWQWGNLHTVTFKHPFGSRKPLETVFNIGPFPASGGGTTINKSEYKFMFPYTTSVGPSMRLVVDLARPLTAWTVITSGQSGQPFHTHYDDQASLWLNGGYHQVTLDWNEIRRSRWEHLGLRP